jgi:hypothetical protein
MAAVAAAVAMMCFTASGGTNPVPGRLDSVGSISSRHRLLVPDPAAGSDFMRAKYRHIAGDTLGGTN